MDEDNTETAGGTRFSSGKPGMWWAVPLYGLRLVAKVTEYGGDKYAPLDWREGQSFSTLTDCFFRHTLDMLHHGPLSRDEESGLLNAAHAAWNLLAMLTFVATGRDDDLDDVTPWQGVITEDLRAARDLHADGHPGSVMETAADIARERRTREACPDLQLELDDDQSGIVWNPPEDDGDRLTASELIELGERLTLLTGCDLGHAEGLSDDELEDAVSHAREEYGSLPGGVVETGDSLVVDPPGPDEMRAMAEEIMAESSPGSAVAPIYEKSVLDSFDEAFKDAIRERNERMKALLEATVSGARMSDLSPREQLACDLENAGYHVEPAEVGPEVRITGSYANPDPSWKATGKMVTNALNDLYNLPDREYDPVRVGRDRIRALI